MALEAGRRTQAAFPLLSPASPHQPPTAGQGPSQCQGGAGSSSKPPNLFSHHRKRDQGGALLLAK